MRRMLALLLCAALALSGCTYFAVNQPAGEDVYDLYYMAADLSAAAGGDAVAAERAALPELRDLGGREAAGGLMEALLQGPAGETLKTPFPAGTQLLSVELADGHATVDLSLAYGSLSGVALTIADYCVTLTLTQLAAVASVSVTVRGQELGYRDQQYFSDLDVLLSSTEDVVSTVPVTLWLLDKDGVLTGVEERIDLYEGDTQISALVDALKRGPQERGYATALPEGFDVLSARLEDDVCYVNLSTTVLAALPEGADVQTALDALAESLVSLETVSQVRYLVNGEFADWYGGAPVARTYPREG